jgi:hypothetical protein
VIPLTDFKLMPDNMLDAWRNHICDSFAEGSTLKAPLRFLSADHTEPKLTVLQMGSKSTSKVAEQKGKRKRTARSKEAKGKGKKRARMAKRKTHSQDFIASSDSEPEAVDSSDTGSDSEAEADAERAALKRSRPHRAAAQKATLSISRTVANINRIEAVETSNRPKPRPLIPKSLPGSPAELEKKAKARAPVAILDAKSLFLQRTCMVKGTLPDDWKAVGFKADQVSFLIVLIFSKPRLAYSV